MPVEARKMLVSNYAVLGVPVVDAAREKIKSALAAAAATAAVGRVTVL